jgi:aryl-alcohol dehydrogenase-like predicted oxidoreductase
MITLPKTDLVVHPLCLGGNVFGWGADSKESEVVLDAYRAEGGNFIDTADVYSQWVVGNKGGESEEIIGSWLAKNGNRKEMVIATKVSKLAGRVGLASSNIIAACEDSLTRLKTDYIDIYYSHSDDQSVPFEETLGAYAKLIDEGKIRYIAASQHKASRLKEALEVSRRNSLPSYIALQDQYNLMEREPFESEQSEVLKQNGLSLLPYYSLAEGFLTGKYREGLEVDSIRANNVSKYANAKGWKVVAALDSISKSHSQPIAAVALSWLRSHAEVSAPIASARTVSQLKEIMQVVNLSPEEIQLLNEASA